MTKSIRRLSGTVAFAFVVGTLVGCAAAGDEQSLADTKSPVQLLRNEAASRIPADLVEQVLVQQDESTACRTTETDPEGLLRSWRSIVRLQLRYDEAIDPQAVIEQLAGTFVDDGWDQGTFGVASIIDLTRGGSETQIHISMSEADDEAQSGAEVQLAVSGPCVMTAGAESDEVTKLGVEE